MGLGNWLKNRRQAKAKEELLRIGLSATDKANEAIEQWEVSILQPRRAMMADFFDERVVAFTSEDGLPFEEWADIETMACLNQWIEKKPGIYKEFAALMDADAWEALKVIGVEEELLLKLEERFDEIGKLLAEDMVIAIDEEQARRGNPK